MPAAPSPAFKRSPEIHNTRAQSETVIKGGSPSHTSSYFSFSLLPTLIVPTRHNFLLADQSYFPLWSG